LATDPNLATVPELQPAAGVHHSGYDPSTLDAVLGETAQLLRHLGFAARHAVLIGGVVPSLLVLDPPGAAHVGTTDIDLCLSVALVDGDTAEYERIEQSLRAAGFQQADTSFRWQQTGGMRLVVEFFCPAGEGREVGKLFRPKKADNPTAKHNMGGQLSALVLDAGNLISADTVTVAREVTLPGGAGRMQAEFTVCGLVGFLAAKTAALRGRNKPKDAYDIVWIVENWSGGPAAAAATISASPLYGTPEVTRELNRLFAAFATPEHVGPASYTTFLSSPEADRDTRMRYARQAAGALRELQRNLPQD
jgi:hypothetical protein